MTIVIAEIEQDQHLLVSSLFGCIVVFWLLQYWTLLLSFQSGAKIQPSHWKPLVSRSRNTRKESFLWQGRVVNLQTPLLVCRLLRASEECCLWRAAFGRSMEPAPWDPWCPSCPAGTLLLHLWPYKEKCLYSRGNGRGQEASLLRRRWMPGVTSPPAARGAHTASSAGKPPLHVWSSEWDLAAAVLPNATRESNATGNKNPFW